MLGSIAEKLARNLLGSNRTGDGLAQPASRSGFGPVSTYYLPLGDVLMKKQQGFTLIELMIVVAIIAILAAIALPAYQDYLVKSRVSEVMLAASSARTTVSEAAATDTAAGTAMPAAVDIETQASKYVTSVTYANGRITATAKDLGGTTPTGTIVLIGAKSANGQVNWTCTGTIAAKYRPATCQGAMPTTGG